MKTNKLVFLMVLLLGLGLIVSCNDDDDPSPGGDDGEEMITKVDLTFTPITGSEVVTATWFDVDGDGVELPTTEKIELEEGVVYTLTMVLTNTLVDPDEDITAEIQDEDDEHQFFFGFTEGIFTTPEGNGNIDNAADPIVYNDTDDNGLPLGLSTTWTTGAHTDETGEFTVVLKHQPELKTATSDANVGGTDINITFPIDIVEEGHGGDDDEEVINEVVLTFTPEGGGDPVTATWFDSDGDGVTNPTIDEIDLEEGVEYTLAITLANTLADPDEDVTAEVLAEDDEHQFFFEFTNNIFADPTGNGNVDTSTDPINYEDMDENGLPVGLTTSWTAGAHTDAAGEFTVILKHQPGVKSATSTANDGGTDVNVTFPINIEEDPNEEEEVINEVVLTFTPSGGGDAVTATWFDADGEGVGNPTIDDIDLEEGIEYNLTIALANTLEDPDEDVTAEIQEEDDEHQFFFAFTNNIFSDPTGDGNVDNASDPVNYADMDENGLPVGLSTTWTAGAHTETAGEFNIILKHQPGIKSASSTSNDGGTDIDITFPLNILEDPNEEEEVIELTFTPTGGGDAVTATWFDADGEGVGNPTIDVIELAPNTSYDMAITLTNTLGMMDEDVTAEIQQEDDEHMFFFSFTTDIFSDPAGDGNVDNRNDDINYNDQDENGLPVGLSTNWTTGAATTSDGTFNVVLKHQPGIKSGTSTSNDGGTDIDIEFDISIE